MYLMPWKFFCDLRFHEILPTTITWRIMKGNEEIEKKSKNTIKNSWNCIEIFMCVVSVTVYVFVWVILTYYYVWMHKWCLVEMGVNIYTQIHTNFYGIKYMWLRILTMTG